MGVAAFTDKWMLTLVDVANSRLRGFSDWKPCFYLLKQFSTVFMYLILLATSLCSCFYFLFYIQNTSVSMQCSDIVCIWSEH